MKLYSKFRKEIQVGALSLFVFAISLFLFWKEDTADFGEGRKETVGNITFKYRTAQRKFSDRMIWQDVEQNFPIFNHDSVRTDELSEAVITLSSGTKFELDPRSMIVINLKEDEELLELEEGSVRVQSEKPVTLTSGKTTIKSENQSTLFRLTRGESGEENVIESTKGSLRWIGSNKESVVLKEGEKAKFVNDSFAQIRDEWKLLEPQDNHRIFPDSGEAKISFRWNSNGGASGFLEISLNRNFSPLILKKEIKGESADTNLPEGIYYWRILSSDRKKNSETRKFRVLPNPPVTLLFPLKNTLLEGSSLQSFRWKPSRLATGYILEISESVDFKKGLRQLTVFKTSISIPLSAGKYHWRVKSFSNLPGTESISETRSFQVEKNESAPQELLSAETNPETKTVPKEESKEKENQLPKEVSSLPVLVFPIKGRVVDMTGQNSIVFRWKHGTASRDQKWSLTLYGAKGESILKRSVNGESFRLTDLSVLDVGKFSWSLSQDGNDSNQVRSDFRIELREDLAAPEAKASGKKGE